MLAQRSFEDLGTPLSQVTFCVVDLETTGGSPADSAITEVGAVKVLRGEVVGTFQTLVDPGVPVPAFIRLLTGITDELLIEAPPIETVLPSFLEFVRDTVLVAHNARFDISFLNHALVKRGYEKLPNRVLDTAALARKILAGEVPNNRLQTLASHLRCAHQPCHRAFADVLATTDVLHHLIERVAGFGVATIEDLAALSSSRLDGTFSKISLTTGLPKGCGVYRFVGATGNTLYVGKATNVRARVRSYFYGDPRRKIKDLLRETQSIEVEVHASLLEAEVAEARAIQRELPPYNRAGKRAANWYLKATTKGRAGKVAPARAPKEDGAVYLGPFSSVRTVKTLIDGLRDAARIHRCAKPSACNGCAFAQMGRCAPALDDAGNEHLSEVKAITDALSRDPSSLYDMLAERMRRLAHQERFEEAAELRQRAALLERTLTRNISIAALLDAGEVVLKQGTRMLLIHNAQLAAAGEMDGDPALALDRLRRVAVSDEVGSYLTAGQQAEARVITGWVERHADELEIVSVGSTWALPLNARPEGRFLAREA